MEKEDTVSVQWAQEDVETSYSLLNNKNNIHSEIPQVVSASTEMAYVIHTEIHSSASISRKRDSVTLPRAVRTRRQHFMCAAQMPTVSEPQKVFTRG